MAGAPILFEKKSRREITETRAAFYGIDQQSKKFIEPPEQIRKEIALLKANKSIPEAEKQDDLHNSTRPSKRQSPCV